MKLYNTLNRKVETIEPIKAPTVGIYTCGPTVYDYSHVGHWFNYVRMDILVRALRADGLEPKWVMNITDVGHLISDADEGEDKLEKGARREGKTAWEVAEFYTKDFLQGMKDLNMLAVDIICKATDHIPEQIELIQRLENKGFTYVIDDGVYYDTSKFARYANFALLDLDEQQEGARVTVNPQKRNARDFALWKFSTAAKQRDMEWESPWGKGFPGWHIECSAMSMKYLGTTLDIHTGGIDHIPVHHTNEIAQSEAATGKPFAKYWLHSNHLMVDGKKISKSLGNGVRLQEIAKRGISPLALRLHVLESHYRRQARFSWDSLEAAQNRLQNWQDAADLRWQTSESAAEQGEYFFVTHTPSTNILNDLDTPHALYAIDQVFSTIQDGLAAADQVAFKSFLQDIDASLGLPLANRPDISASQRTLLAKRQEARDTKEWSSSDELRDQLQKAGISVRDTSQGQIWSRATL